MEKSLSLTFGIFEVSFYPKIFFLKTTLKEFDYCISHTGIFEKEGCDFTTDKRHV